MKTYEWDICVPGALRALKTQFTTSTTFVSELLQNARRAGATCVHIEYEPASGLMTVNDDGCGIKDFKNLFVGYQSGWGEDVIEREQPFGVGFMAAALSSEQVVIHSLDQRVCFDGDDPFDKPVTVYEAPYRAGTEIRLQLRQELRHSMEEWTQILRDLVLGFPIPVHFARTPLPRPYAIGQGLAFRATALGELYLEGWEACRPTSRRFTPTLYCQGLPLHVRRGSTNPTSVLHVNTMRFRARSPDRDVLHEADRNEPIIEDAVFKLWQERLAQRRTELAPQEFVDQHWRLCIYLKLPDLLRDMPLSATMLTRLSEPVCLIDSRRASPSPWDQAPLPDPGSLIIHDVGDNDYFGDQDDPPAPLASVYALTRNLPMLEWDVPQTHWASQEAVDLLDPSVGLAYEIHGGGEPQRFVGRSVSPLVQLCDGYTISFRPVPSCSVPLSRREQLKPITVKNIAVYDNQTDLLIVPAECHDGQSALEQMSSYEDDERFQADDFDEDYEALAGFIASLRANSPEQYLRALLRPIRPNVEMLGNHKFQVSYGTAGWCVELASTVSPG